MGCISCGTSLPGTRDRVVKKRIIPKFLLSGGRLVKGVRFHENMREAGNPVTTARVYDSYGVDELIFLDIDATVASTQTVARVIADVARDVFMPLTAGGGVRTLDDINALLRAGADKVSVNTAAIVDPSFVSRAARRFGDQCITVAIDYRVEGDGTARVYSHAGTQRTEMDVRSWACRMQDAGCGEILLCSIDRDGTMAGCDISTLDEMATTLEVPLIAASGVGSLQHCIEVLRTDVSALAIGSLFLFTDHSPIKVRSYLASNGIDVRASTSSRN